MHDRTEHEAYFDEFRKQFMREPVAEVPGSALNSPPLVSVIVTTFNHAMFIRDCLEGILAQRADFGFEVLLGDDESSDGTHDICREYARRFPERIRLFLHKRTNNIRIAGQPTGRFNFCYSLLSSRGKYVAICEGDDYWTDPDKLQKQVAVLGKNRDCSVCYHDSVVINAGGELLGLSRLPRESQRDYTRDELIKAFKILPQTMCFRNILKPFPPEFYQAFGGDKFLTSLLGWHGSGKFLADIKPSVFRIHRGGINAGEIDIHRQRSKHLSTRVSLAAYYRRTGFPVYADYFHGQGISLLRTGISMPNDGHSKHGKSELARSISS